MKNMIKDYKVSCKMVAERIGELRFQRKTLRREKNEAEIEQLNLERRIRLLHTEYKQAQMVIRELESYERSSDILIRG